MIPFAIIPALPVLAAILLIRLQTAEARRSVELASSLLVLLCAIGLTVTAEAPSSSTLIAALAGIGALTDAAESGDRHQSSQAARQVRLAAMLAALVPAHPFATWLALAAAGAASAGTRLPRLSAALSQLLPCNAALGIALFGVVALQVNSVTIGSIALLLGWGTLVLLDSALLPVLLLLALRLQADLSASPQAALVGHLMVGGGIGDLLLIAAIVVMRPRSGRQPAWLTLAQGGVALCAFGVGGPELRFAGLLHLTLLTLSRSALLLSSDAGLDRVASLAGMSGLPPFGVFPSLALILLGIAIRVPWLLVPLGIGLVIVAWRSLARLPQEVARLRPSVAWLPLAIAVVIGLALPKPIAAWFAAAAENVR